MGRLTPVPSRAGFERTNLSGEAAYVSFVPAPLPPNPPLDLTDDLVRALAEARSDLAALSSAAAHVPSVSLFQTMYVRKEALLSAQIEGTQATLEDILDPGLDTHANLDAADVINYVKAMDAGLAGLTDLPLCNRLIQQVHAIMVAGVRGEDKTPGEFRRSQNWIGGAGSTLASARYIPPNVVDMTRAMGDLEQYMNTATEDPLVAAALIHYQFETIHPFLDGNGRVGRLLIVLYLVARGLLAAPVLYVSLFLKTNRIEYFDRMTEVRRTGNYEQWVTFFLQGVSLSARDALAAIDDLAALRHADEARITALGRARFTCARVLDHCQAYPIVDVPSTARALGVTFATAAAAVGRLVDLGILVPSTTNRRNRVFTYAAYLDILRQGT